MGARLAGILIAVCACKAQLDGGPSAGTDAARGDSPARMIDAPPIDGLPAWSTPAVISGADLNGTLTALDDPAVSPDGLELIYSAVPSGGTVRSLYAMTRVTTNDPWGTPALITELQSTTSETTARFSPDGLTLYFSRGGDIYTATRMTLGGTWTSNGPLAEVNVSGDSQRWMAVCDNGYFVLTRNVPTSGTGNDLYVGQLGVGSGTKSSLSTPYNDNCAYLAADCLTIYFASDRADMTNNEIYVATRATATVDFGTPQLVAPPSDPDVNAPASSQDDPGTTTDQRLFVFSRYPAGTSAGNQLYQSTR